nr:MAG: hypothetical protein [Bacteriophage sp.]
MPILKIGEKFGLITVIGEPEKRRNGTYYLCMCDSGETLKEPVNIKKRHKKKNLS